MKLFEKREILYKIIGLIGGLILGSFLMKIIYGEVSFWFIGITALFGIPFMLYEEKILKTNINISPVYKTILKIILTVVILIVSVGLATSLPIPAKILFPLIAGSIITKVIWKFKF